MEQQVVIPAGDEQIRGVLHMPDNLSAEKHSVIVICHGFISSKVGQHRLFVKAARTFCQAGFAFLRFDYSGCGESSGEHKNITFANQLKETVAVLDFLGTYPVIDSDAVILLGHSFGGGIASTVAVSDKRISRLILWSTVANPLADILGIVGKELYQQSLDGQPVHYQGFELGRQFFLSLLQIAPLETIKDFGGDVLLVHGTADVETPLANTQLFDRTLKQRPGGRHEVKLIDGADHTYSTPQWEQAVIQSTVQWLTGK